MTPYAVDTSGTQLLGSQLPGKRWHIHAWNLHTAAASEEAQFGDSTMTEIGGPIGLQPDQSNVQDGTLKDSWITTSTGAQPTITSVNDNRIKGTVWMSPRAAR